MATATTANNNRNTNSDNRNNCEQQPQHQQWQPQQLPNGAQSPMPSGGKVTRAIKIGELKTCNVRTKFDKWGRKNLSLPNGYKRLKNWRAKILTGGSRVGSLDVGSDEKHSSPELICSFLIHTHGNHLVTFE